MRLALTGCCFLICFIATSQGVDTFHQRVQRIADYNTRIEQYLDRLDGLATRDFDATIKLADEALQMARAKGDSTRVGRILRHRGEAAYFKGNYDEAARQFYGSMQLLEKDKKDASQLAYSLNALAKLYRKTRDLPRSLQHYERALAIFRSLGDSAGASMILNESGVVFEYANDYPAAIERYTASLRIDEQRRDSLGISYALSNLAGVHTLQRRYAEADRDLQQALTIRKRLRDTFALALNYADLGTLCLSDGRLQQARSYTDNSNVIAAAMGYLELQRNNYELLANIAEANGQHSAALAYFRKRSQLQDSIFNTERARSIEELNTKYETLKKEQTIREQQFALSRKNFWLVASALLLMLAVALGYSIYRRRRLAHRHALQTLLFEQQELATRAVMDAEEAERQRIAKDLHDGVGQMMSAARMNLSALASRLPLQDADNQESFDKVFALVDESCREVRAVSHNMMPNALLKNSLAAAVRDFLDKIDHRALQVRLYVEGLDERLEGNVETVLYRVLQECVNNVIKHAGASQLDIAILRDATEITATVEDNGKGFDSGTAEEGLGLRNIRARIEYLKGTVEFDSRPGKGTLVAIQIPL